MMKNVKAPERGFTLLEVLIALTLMAMLSLLSWRALETTARSNERLEAGADDTMALLRVLGQIESDIHQHAGTHLPHATPLTTSTPLEAVLPAAIQWQMPHLSILRTNHHGAWQEVTWALSGNALVRAVGAPSTRLPLPAATHPELMLSGVRSFSLRAWLPGRGWVESVAPPASLAATGLEIAIVRHHNGADEAYRKVVVLP